MLRFHHCLFALALSLTLTATADAGYIMQSASFGGKNYHLVASNSSKQRIHWADAQAYAVTLGGNLVTVNSAAENDFLRDTFSAAAISAKSSAHSTGGLLSLWLGFNDAATEGNFVWVGGGGTGYTNWKPGEPATGSGGNAQDYAAMLVTSAFGSPGQWHDVLNDFSGNDVTYGLVEVDAVPAPPAVALFAVGAVVMAGCRRFWKRSVA